MMKELAQKYGLTRSDFWQMRRGGSEIWILTHDACEKIAAVENVKVLSPTWLAKGEGPTERWALEVRGYIDRGGNDRPCAKDEMTWTTGEADNKNCKSGYPVAIAEKRAKDRLTLKLIKAYQLGIYSESESDSFSRGSND